MVLLAAPGTGEFGCPLEDCRVKPTAACRLPTGTDGHAGDMGRTLMRWSRQHAASMCKSSLATTLGLGAAYRLLAAHLSWCQMLGLGPCSSMSMRHRAEGIIAGHANEPLREVVFSQAQQLKEVQLIIRSWNSACSAQNAGHVGQCLIASDLHMEAHSQVSVSSPQPHAWAASLTCLLTREGIARK